jgi:hypothetical protein
MKPQNKITQSWNDLSFSEWKELQEIRRTEWESDMQRIIEEISLLWDCSPDDPYFDSVAYDELIGEYIKFSWTFSTPPKTPQNEIIINGETYYLKPLSQLTLGEYIDINEWFKENVNNLGLIAGCLWRKMKINEWGNKKWEPYEYQIEERAKLFENVPISYIYGVLESSSVWLKDIVDNYPNIFEPEGWDEIEGEDQLDPEEVVQIRKEIEQEKKKAPFSWLGIVWELAKHDVSRFDTVFNTPVILVFNTLSMRKALAV